MDRKHLFDIHFFYNNISSYFFMTNQNDYHLKYPIFKGADMTEKLMARLQQAMDHNPEDIEQMKKNGHAAVGYYCLYSPMEIAVAAGAIPLPLCGTSNKPITAAEDVLPRNLCPLIKSSYGFAITNTCPFFAFSDIIIGDTTCDGKKKMFELLSRTKTTYVLQLPSNQDDDTALVTWKKELHRLKDIVEQLIGVTITSDKLKDAIHLMNRERMTRKALMDVNRAIPTPLPGSKLLEILFKVGFLADKEKGIELMQEVIAHHKTASPAAESSNRKKRILLTGVPVGIGSEKVIRIVEQIGADVVAFESCSGYKQAFQVAEDKESMDALAEQYLKTPCSVMSPNNGRVALLAELIEKFAVDGVIDLTWQACHTYNIEAFMVDELVQEHLGVPALHLETDYSESDTGQLRVRIEAYIEML